MVLYTWPSLWSIEKAPPKAVIAGYDPPAGGQSEARKSPLISAAQLNIWLPIKLLHVVSQSRNLGRPESWEVSWMWLPIDHYMQSVWLPIKPTLKMWELSLHLSYFFGVGVTMHLPNETTTALAMLFQPPNSITRTSKWTFIFELAWTLK